MSLKSQYPSSSFYFSGQHFKTRELGQGCSCSQNNNWQVIYFLEHITQYSRCTSCGLSINTTEINKTEFPVVVLTLGNKRRHRLLKFYTVIPFCYRYRCNSQKYTYPRNYTPGIFSHMKISQKHTGGMCLHQAIRNG